jgi:hypothetical protein
MTTIDNATDEPDVDQPQSEPRRAFGLVKSQRTLQVILGLFWIVDAALQYQPFMFGKQFVPTFITANASGQPEPISWLITNAGHFISPDVAVWNALFATVQIFIGFGLLFRRTVRPALVISIFWAFGVWFFGEGMGEVLTGTASALTGAPGSVSIYGLLALMAWPRATRLDAESSETLEVESGIASSAAAQGIGGIRTPLAVWSGYWVISAVLFVLPANRTQTSISSAITGMESGTPEWYSHFLHGFGSSFGSIGTQSAWILAALSLLVGLGPLVVRRPGIFLLGGGLLSLAFWIGGQGFLGDVFTGSGTDPNTSPLIILLALSMAPTVLAYGMSWTAPLEGLLRHRPSVAIGGGAAIACALILAGSYPVAASESSSTSMSGMNMASRDSSSGSSSMAMTGTGGTSAASASCTKGNNHAPRSGLDVTNTPNMIMSGSLGMNMNGSDATAAAGLNATKSNWTYTGPALPSALAQELLAEGSNDPGTVHMAESGCSAEPTFLEEINAFQYVQATSQTVARFTTPFAAVAAGYVAASPTNYPVVYYVNPTIEAANAASKASLNPENVDGLVFAQTPSGREVLAAAFYVLPSTLTAAPMPYGALVQWHQRTDVCGPKTAPGANTLDITGVIPCAAGMVERASPYLTMVWQIPVAGGPLAIQPPDIQIVEASIMATSQQP